MEESAVKVCVRVRPLIAREESAAAESLALGSPKPVPLFWKADKKSIHQIDDGNSTKSFVFDRVFTADETTNQLYQEIAKPLVVSTVKGYNGTIFAYGQTSSGKTFTMMGGDRIHGVIPLAVDEVFQTIRNCSKKEFLLRVSYMEIYNETVSDLLVDSRKRKPLEVRETINKNIYVADLTEELVTSTSQVLAWIRKGEENRHYAKTKMNDRSSRSHTIFRMILESREVSEPASGEIADGAVIVSHLNLVDLAGSERASQTGAEGTHFKEGCNINRSLFTLGQVIKKLTDESQKSFTNYRDSKLTRILQNSLGGNAKTVIICTITPAALDETLSTLQFASTAKKMKNDPHVTEVSDDGALLKRYRNEIVDLKRRLHEVSSHTHTSATEKEVLSQLLQEKDQLQREQEDRIKNLTTLLVSSSNLVPVRKRPKRRVTWGGKMAHLSTRDDGPSDLSSGEPFARRRRADRSCMSDLCEGRQERRECTHVTACLMVDCALTVKCLSTEEEDFDGHWEIADEPSYEMYMSQSSVTVRSFGDSPKDSMSPEGTYNLSGKVSNLERQLEMETKHKEEAMTKVEALDGVVAELQLQLQTESLQKQEALEKMQMAEQRAGEAELQLQLQTESLPKQEALEKMQMAEQRAGEAELQLQLQTESLQKQEALEKMQMAEQRAGEAELQLQLQTESLQKQEALEKMQTGEPRAGEVELQTEAQLEANEKVEMLNLRVADLEKQLEEQSHTWSDTDEQMKKEFSETIQLCETLAKEKDEVTAERHYLKEELGMFMEEIKRLEEEKATLSKELEEKRELAEFNSLEEEFRKEHQNELQNEVSKLKSDLESSELQRLELQNNLETMSKELQNKSEFAEELQSLSGKDLVKEVVALRRSLDDAEGLSRDTKKEWAHLRSKNIAVEEMNVNLNAGYEKMDAEVVRLRSQLEAEKSRYRAMQSDLQKELNVAFDENTKLTALLDGNVPKNLIDGLELEKTAARLSTELASSQEAEGSLRAQLEELAPLQALPDQVADLTKQLNELSQELQRVQAEKDALLSEQSSSAEEAEKLLSSITSLTAERDQLIRDLQEHVEEAAQTQLLLQSLQGELQEQTQQNSNMVELAKQKQVESDQHMQSLSEEAEKLLTSITSLTAERDQLIRDLQEHVEEAAQTQLLLQSLQGELQEQTQQNSNMVELAKQKQVESDQHMQSLSEELQRVQAEKDALLSEQSSSAEEAEKLLSSITSLTAERDQLRTDLQENVEMMIENQEELRTALEKNRKQKEQIKLLEAAQTSEQEAAEMEEMQVQRKELPALPEQKNQMEGDLQSAPEMTEASQSLLQSLQEKTQELMQKNMELETLQERKAQLEQQVAQTESLLSSLQEELRERRESGLDRQSLAEQLESVRAERDALSLKMSSCPTPTEESGQLLRRVASLAEERDQLLETLQAVREEKQQLRAELEDRMETVQCDLQLGAEPQSLKEEQDLCSALQIQQLEEHLEKKEEELSQFKSDLQGNVELTRTLSEKLQLVEAERDALISVKDSILQTSTEETEGLLCRVTSLSEERDQLLETLEGVRREEKQLEVKMETMQTETRTLSEKLQLVEAERDALISTKDSILQTSTEETEGLLCRVTSLSEERDQLLETLEGVRREEKQLRAQLEDKMENMQMETRTLSEKLQLVEAERDALISTKDSILQTSTEETEGLLCRVTSLSEERDQLLETLEGVRREEKQLRAQLEDKMENMQMEITQLETSLQVVTEQKGELEAELQRSEAVASSTQELVKSLQEELGAQNQRNSDLDQLCQEKERSLDQQTRTLSEKLQLVEAERDALISVKDSILQTSTEETEGLLCRVTSLSEERDQLLETLEGVRREEKQLEDKMETMQMETRTLSEKLQLVEAERDALISTKDSILQTSTEETEGLLCRVTSLSEERDQLLETLEGVRREEKQLRAQLEDKMETMLSDANSTISGLREQLAALEQHAGGGEAAEAAALRDSRAQLQESFGRLQRFVDVFPKYDPCAQDRQQQSGRPDPSMDAYSAVLREMGQTLGDIKEQLLVRAQGYRSLMEYLVETDMAVFEERRLQDSLLQRVGAPRHSAREEDVGALLEKRQLYLQKTSRVLRGLQANRDSYCSELSEELAVRERFKEQVKALDAIQPFSSAKLNGLLSGEVEHRSAMAQRRKMTLQGITEEHSGLSGELKRLQAQADSRLSDEKRKTAALLQALEGAPSQAEPGLLKANQQLALQLRQAEEEVTALRAQIKQLEEAQLKASSRVSNHKQATQLLQTELQDSRAQVEEKDGTIRALKAKLRHSEENASPSAVELEKLRAKLFKMEVELSSASDEHKREMQTMSTVLKEKEESVRKLKETLRKSQQQGEDSLLQGEELHARLINPRGLVVQTSIALEKTKLEEEVKQLRLKITELESLVSSHQEEIGKWKGRAIKLKAMSKVEGDKPSNPTKRGLSVSSDTSDFLGSPKKVLVTPRNVLDSPRKVPVNPRNVLDSPRKALDSPKRALDSPRKAPHSPATSFLDYSKSSFFNGGGGSELLSRTCPKQFFDNSSLGTNPGVFDAPDRPGAEKDAAAGADRKEDWWPQSPKQEEMCKTQ
ncbi:centromere-associated protein E [Pungitius pungitius]|uniref:centromere-associated protein E n=1 Tax=Pungitius pungitius TaxID=134920 RepID=UPI002E0E547A